MVNQVETTKFVEAEENSQKPDENADQDDIFNSLSKITVEPGESFGDFSKITEKKYNPCYAVVVSERAKLLQLNRNDVDNLGK